MTSDELIAPSAASPVAALAPGRSLDASSCRTPNPAVAQLEQKLQEINSKPKKKSEFISYLEKNFEEK